MDFEEATDTDDVDWCFCSIDLIISRIASMMAVEVIKAAGSLVKLRTVTSSKGRKEMPYQMVWQFLSPPFLASRHRIIYDHNWNYEDFYTYLVISSLSIGLK